MKNNNTVSNETSLSVRDNNPIVVSSGPVQSNPAPKKAEPQKDEKKKKKSPLVAIIIIIVVLLILGAAGYFGYRYYINKEVLEDLTGTWVYDTATSDAGYVSFLGDDQVLVDGTFYNVSASKQKLTFARNDDTKIAVEYILAGDELLLALGINNEFFESCNVTVSGTDAGVMLYQIDSDPYLDDEAILEAYYEQFPKYAVNEYLDSIIDWGSLEGIFSEDFSYDDLEGYLNNFENADSIDDFISGFLPDNSTSDENTNDFDLSDLLDSFISGYIGDFGDEAGAAVGDAVDGTELEDAAEIIYDFYEFYNSVTDEESSEEDILGAIGDLFN